MADQYLKYAFLINAHTHIGDAFISLPEKKFSVEELVAPPHGYKYKMMAKARREEIIDGMRKVIKKMERIGTYAFIDFREGGVQGIKMLKEAMNGNIKAIILGRPSKMEYDKDEVDRLLSISHGIGLSSVSDWEYEEIEKIAEHVNKKNKIFALHVSEARHEDIDDVLKLKPNFIVHMCMAKKQDIEKVAEENIPVVICPRANSFFGLRPKVEILMEYGVKLMLGTDNAMIVEPNIIEEMNYLIKNFDVKKRDAIKMISETPKKLFQKNFKNGKRMRMKVLKKKTYSCWRYNEKSKGKRCNE